jgi:hypothetical protein
MFHSIAYADTPQIGGNEKMEEWDWAGIGWNRFHHTPFHSVHFLQNQTIESNIILHRSIQFHYFPSIQI